MCTFTELRFLFAESIFLKYCSYFLPLLLFLFTKHVWKHLFASRSNETRIQKEVIDIGENIQTDSNDDPNDETHKPHLPEREHVPYRGITEWLDKSGEQFYKLANNRRSIRKFAPNKQVDLKVIEKCILAAGEHC